MPTGATIAAASLGGAAIQADAAGKASNAASDAAAQNLAFNKQVYSNAQGNLNPFVSQGQTANTALSGLLGIGGDPNAANAAFNNYRNSTNYNFQLGQGLQGIEYANAPSFNSGATAKALNNYAQGQAGNSINNYETLLGGQAGLGAQAGSALNGVSTNTALLNQGATQYGANATGAADAATGNAWTNALKNVGSGLSSYLAGGAPGSNGVASPTNALGASIYQPTPTSSAFSDLNTNIPSIFG